MLVSASGPTLALILQIIQSIFSWNRYRDVMVSDIATIFKSEEFTKFCKGDFQKFVAPSDPATNGLAERIVRKKL